MIDPAALNGPDPPTVLDAVDVDMYALATRRYGRMLPPWGIPVFIWVREDGAELAYYRWLDEDGERYYPYDEFARRAGLTEP